MINHYIDLHEYINENIYRLPVKENQIITEAINWGGVIKNTLIGGGIIGLILLILKFISGKNNNSSSGGSSSSGGGSSSNSSLSNISYGKTLNSLTINSLLPKNFNKNQIQVKLSEDIIKNKNKEKQEVKSVLQK